MSKNIILRIVQKIKPDLLETTLTPFSSLDTAFTAKSYFDERKHWNVLRADVLELSDEELKSDYYQSQHKRREKC